MFFLFLLGMEVVLGFVVLPNDGEVVYLEIDVDVVA